MSKFPGIIILMLFYVSFLIGLTTGKDQEWFLNYGASFIYLNTILILFYQEEWTKAILKLFVASYIFGFGIELIAIKTNYIFGNYHFGDSLGFSIAGVPIAIGFYWLILTYSTANISSKLPIKSVYIKASIGALLQVSLILLTIQVASRLDFWHLENINDKINYCLIWFLVCFIVQSYYYKLKIILSNRIASIVYGGLCVFFVGLITFLK